MKTLLLLCLIGFLGAAACRGEAPPAPAAPPEEGAAAALMESAVSILPTEPVVLRGTLTVRRQRGQVLREVPFVIRLDWGATPPKAVYELRDGFGRTLEQLTVLRHGQRSELIMQQGEGLVVTNAPSLAGRVQGTDITWLDLTLDFLWWRNARLDGTQEVRGRLCDRVIAVPPEPIPGCSGMRLWLDRQTRFLMQAEQLDPQGNPARRMWVDSLRKIDDRWIIRNMEIEGASGGHRTRLRVEDAELP